MKMICEYIEDLQSRKEILQDAIAMYTEERGKYYEMGCTAPSELTGLDTTKEAIQSSGKMKFIDAIVHMDRINEKLNKCYAELEQIEEKINAINERVSKLTDKQTKIYFYRNVKKMTQEKTAEELGISERHLQRIEKKIKDGLQWKTD